MRLITSILSAVLVMTALHRPSAADTPAPPDLAQLAWLAGSWTGEAFGGTFEEVWSPPSAGTMVGMFKLVKDGEVVMYELEAIVPVGGSLELRVRHFSAGFEAWEERAEFVRFPLLHLADGVAEFDGLRFVRRDDGTLDVHLRMHDAATGTTREELLRYSPAGGPAASTAPPPPPAPPDAGSTAGTDRNR